MAHGSTQHPPHTPRHAPARRVGRRPLLLQGGVQMLLSLAGVAAVLGTVSRGWAAPGAGAGAGRPAGLMPAGAAGAVLAFMCLFVAGFSWSWGPLGWLIPSEITPLHIRSCGQSLFTAVNFAVAFAGTQMFGSLLCSMAWGIYLFFGVWVALMIVYAAWFLPETKGVPIEQMQQVWDGHWLWRRVAAAGAPGLPA
jgi:type IV secretory pathway TrbD component